MKSILVVLVLAMARQDLLAGSCAVRQPCERLRRDSIFFVGTVTEAVFVGPAQTRDFHFRIDEAFAGIENHDKDVVVTTDAESFELHRQYLVDAVPRTLDRLDLRACGGTWGANDPKATELIEFLRQRALGKENTSLSVRVIGGFSPLPDARVTITSADSKLSRSAGQNGVVLFDALKHGRYVIEASHSHFHPVSNALSDRGLDIPDGACATASLVLAPDSAVSGVVRNVKGVAMALVRLELSDGIETQSAATDDQGRFHFASIAPGRYQLRTAASGMPLSYYPGVRRADLAFPIQVLPGEAVEGLQMTLPDFGETREIQICVVDELGGAIAGAQVDSVRMQGEDNASLGPKALKTDTSGCLKTEGYTGAAYPVRASFRLVGAGPLEMRFSELDVIEPGDEPVKRVLILNQRLGQPRPTKRQ